MLKTSLCGIELKNPIITASGTFGFGKEFTPYIDISKLGAICSKAVTLHPREGNLGVRSWETPSGMLNSVGLQNPGIDAFINSELPIMKKLGTNIIVNLGGDNTQQYVEGAKLLDKTDIHMIELNISCPNVKEGGMAFGNDPKAAYDIVLAVRKATSKPLMVKLSPNAPSIVDVALAAQKAGADCLSLINTISAMVINLRTRKPMFRNTTAGLSGPAIKPIALRMVYDVCKAVSIPVVGIGGIMTGEDAAEFIMAGATAVQVGTANFVRPDNSIRIIKQLEAFLALNKIESLDEIRGAAL